MAKVDLSVAERLLALATNHAASLEEKRTAAVIVCEFLVQEGVLAHYRKTAQPEITTLGYEAEQAEWAAVAQELVLLHRATQAPEYQRPRWKDVQETLRKRLHVRGLRPMTEEEIAVETGRRRRVDPNEVVRMGGR